MNNKKKKAKKTLFGIFSSAYFFILVPMSMLKSLFSSKARIKLLNTFLLNPDTEYFIRELTRKLDEQINSIRRELDNLRKIGLLKSRSKNRKKYFYTNKEFLIFNELRDILLKANNNDSELIRQITKLGEVEVLLLTGVFVGKEAPVDLLVVGEINSEALRKVLSENSKDGKEIRFTAMNKRDFLYRVECKDKFIYDLILDDKAIIVINKLKKELEKVRT